MLLTTVDIKQEYEVLGLVKGTKMKAKHLGKDIMAGLRKIVGGEITEYAEMIREAREEAIDEMIKEAEKLRANAIIGIRFSSSTVTTGAAEIIVYGTAVKI